MNLTAACRSDRGHRLANDDVALAVPELGLFVVADGAGAGFSGAPAAELVVETIRQFFDPRGTDSLAAGLQRANHRIWSRVTLAKRHADDRQASEDDLEWTGRSATAVAMHIADGLATIAHVGGTRAYHASAGELVRLTTDHVQTDGTGPGNVRRFTRQLGAWETVKVDGTFQPVAPGDQIILCSDGITAVLEDFELARLIGRDCVRTAEQWVAAAVDRGATRQTDADNCTAVVVLIG